MVQGDTFTVVITVGGTLTSELKEKLNQEHPDKTFVKAIESCLENALSTGILEDICEEVNISYTNVNAQCNVSKNQTALSEALITK